MVDYGRNLVGNIKVKTRSSGGSFVDMGKTKSDIEKNAQKMEKLVNEIKSDHGHSPDSGRMINDLKEDIRKLRLIQYDSQGKPTEESLMALYGKDVKNAKFKDKDGTLFEVSQFSNSSWYYEIVDSNGHKTGHVGPFKYEDDAIAALKRHNSTVKKISNAGIPPVSKTSKSGTSTSGKPNGGTKKPDDKDKSGKTFGDYLTDNKTGNKNVSPLKEVNNEVKGLKQVLAQLA